MRGDDGGKRGRVVKNMYKGHKDKAKGGVGSRVGGGNGWGGGKMETTVLEQQF